MLESCGCRASINAQLPVQWGASQQLAQRSLAASPAQHSRSQHSIWLPVPAHTHSPTHTTQERELYGEVKKQMYPRACSKPCLRTIESGKRYAATALYPCCLLLACLCVQGMRMLPEALPLASPPVLAGRATLQPG